MRTRIVLLAAAAAALLAGCGHHHYQQCQPCQVEATSLTPLVQFDPARDAAPTVRPNPLVFTKDQKDVTITWRVPAGSTVRFAARDGIVIDGEVTPNFYPEGYPNTGARRAAAAGGKVSGNNPSGMVPDREQNQIVECKVGKEGLEFTCLNRHTRPGIFKYSIKLTDGKSEFIHDPDIVNW